MSKKRKPRSDRGGTHKRGWKWSEEQKAKIKGRKKSLDHKLKIRLTLLQKRDPSLTLEGLKEADRRMEQKKMERRKQMEDELNRIKEMLAKIRGKKQ